MSQKIKKGSIVWSVKHRPPLSMTMVGSALLILMGSKGLIIDNMPISSVETKEILGSWYSYLLEMASVLMGLANIFLGLKKDGVSAPATGINNN